MKILVTGKNGQLGFECIKELHKRGYQDVIGVDKDEFDITDEEGTTSFIIKNCPNVIIHCAAWTQVDTAENNEKQVYKVNAYATKIIAKAAERISAKMIYISTDYVFSGEVEKYYEVNDPTEPRNVYGKSKLLGEIEAKKECSKLFIVRTSWVFGINGNNFIKTMLKLSNNHKELDVVSDQIGSPTYASDLASLLCDMIVTDKYGIYHATNEEICSWADFATEIFTLSNIDIKVNYISTNQYLLNRPNQAYRPKNSRLSKKSLDKAGFKRLPNWKSALRRYLEEIGII